jgi:hypothetical protein
MKDEMFTSQKWTVNEPESLSDVSSLQMHEASPGPGDRMGTGSVTKRARHL